MSRIALLSYNNYYNRIYKKESSLGDYIVHSSNYIVLDNINFNPGDGVSTSLVLGKGTGAFLNWEQGSPDYLVVYKDTDETILSRWFILDENRTRAGQYTVTLRRDLLADYQDSLATAPLYVEKGIIGDINSPLLRNNEGLVVNQIKKEEILLKDVTACPWLIAYVKKGVLGSGSTVGPSQDGKITVHVPDTEVAQILTTPIEQWEYYQYTALNLRISVGHTMLVNFDNPPTIGIQSNKTYQLKSNRTSSVGVGEVLNSNLNTIYNDNDVRTRLDTQFKPRLTSLISAVNTAFSYSGTNPLAIFNGQIIEDSLGKFYRVTAFRNNSGISRHEITSNNAATLKNTMNNLWNDAFNVSTAANNSAFATRVNWEDWRISLEELTDIETVIDFRNYTGAGTVDSPLYDVLCMPYGETNFFIGTEVSVDLDTTAERSMRVMNNLATQLSSQWLLDLQILPYCPCPELINDYAGEGTIFVDGDQANDIVLEGYKTGEGVTDIIVVASHVNFSIDIYNPINAMDLVQGDAVSDAFKIKFINDCTSLRICSPNYNGLYEMNLAKNDMSIDFFNVDVTMRPHNPYIHVNPNYKGLYGQDFNDVRGLICGGDFSLGIINDAWTQYEIQNKNYQAIFDRQIQNLDVNNSIARQEAAFQIMAGTVQGAASGAAAGGMMSGGNAYAAAAGAIIGGVTSAAGGVADYVNLNRRIEENRDFTIDNFNLQLGNIRALPYSITKTSAFTFNNKLFPFIEIYSCTDVEKEAYYNKLRYDGMTIGIIDTIERYKSGNYSNYFKARLIRNTSILGSTHEVQELSNELYKGVYI